MHGQGSADIDSVMQGLELQRYAFGASRTWAVVVTDLAVSGLALIFTVVVGDIRDKHDRLTVSRMGSAEQKAVRQ